MNSDELSGIGCRLRRDVLQMVYDGGSGHCGGSLSAMDILTVLFYETMRLRPEDPLWQSRDRFVLSKGHACPALYAVLADKGFFPKSELKNFRKIGSMLRGHPEYGVPGVETVTGSLGQGFAVAMGMAIGLRQSPEGQRVFCMVGDGEVQEGMVWETALISAHFKLSNFTCFLDYNGLQGDGRISDIMDLHPLDSKWRAFGWQVKVINGHDLEQIRAAVKWAMAVKNAPQMIIAHTVKGKGVCFMENEPSWHGTAPPSDEQLEAALAELRATEERICGR